MKSASASLSGRVLAYTLLSVARSLLTDVRHRKARIIKVNGLVDGARERTYHCMVTPKSKMVSVDYDSVAVSARYGGVQTCGSVWSCPRCSDYINRSRRDTLLRASAVMEKDFYIFHITYTLSHGVRDFLSVSHTALSRAMGKVKGWRQYKRLKVRLGWLYDVTATEVTFSYSNGFHPHRHVLAYCQRSVIDALTCISTDGNELYGIDAALYLIDLELSPLWIKALNSVGFDASLARGVYAVARRDDVMAYITKFGVLPRGWGVEDELTRSHSKLPIADDIERFTPMDLLLAVFNGRVEFGEVWLEYHFAMKGRQQLYFSDGFKAYLSTLGIDLLTDDELADEEQQTGLYSVLFEFDIYTWRSIVRSGLHPLLLDYVESVGGDRLAVVSWLNMNGIDYEYA